MSFRSAIPDFQLANPLYIGAEVRFYTVTVGGTKTAVLAPLYAGPLGATTVANPQVLDAEGKFTTPVYHDVPLIAEVSGISAASFTTGIIMPASSWGDDWVSGVILIVNTFVRDPIGLSIYIATNTYTTSGSITTDRDAGNLKLVFQGQAAEQAAASAAAASAAAVAAAAALGTIQTQRRVAIAYQSAPPGSPSSGDAYVVKTSGSGAWVGQSEKIATWNGSAWTFETPSVGWDVYLTGNATTRTFDGGIWNLPAPADGSISLAMLANITTKRVLGRNESGDGPVELLTGTEIAQLSDGWKPLGRVNLTSSEAFVDLAIPAGSRRLRISGGVSVPVNQQLLLRFSYDNGATYVSSGYNGGYLLQANTSLSAASGASNSGMYISGISDTASVSELPINTTVLLGNTGKYAIVRSESAVYSILTNGLNIVTNIGFSPLLGVATNIRFICTSGSINAGTDFAVEYL